MKDFVAKAQAMLVQAGIKHTKLPELFEDGSRHKEELNKTLGLTPDNHFRRALPLEMTDTDFNTMYPRVKDIFGCLEGWSGPFKPTTGKLKVGNDDVNITKFLAKQFADKKVSLNLMMEFCKTLNIDPGNPKAESQIIPKFGELISKKANDVVIVSTNPFDFLTGSAGDYKYASFKSCFRPGGEYFNGCISLARDDFSTISYKASMDRMDYKQGRAWMFLLEDLVAQTKSYGTFTNNERKTAREYAEGCLANKNQIDKATYKQHHVEKWRKAENRDVIYFDDYAIDLSFPTGKYATFTDGKVPNIKFSDARCLTCGRETKYPMHGVCGVCSGNYNACKKCDKELIGDDQYKVGKLHYCSHCVEELFVKCTYCGNYHEKGTGVDTGTSKSVCPDCVSKYFFLCGSCETYHESKHSTKVTVDGKSWCAGCFKEKGFTCEDCGDKHAKDASGEVNTLQGAKHVCAKCLATYSSCKDCGHAIQDGIHTKDGDLCTVCYEKYDFCLTCQEVVLKTSMVFDGTKICCGACANTGATNEGYIAEIAAIMVQVKELQATKVDTTEEALKKVVEDRKTNGYKTGDILKVVEDSSWHGIPKGTFITVCDIVKNLKNEDVIMTFYKDAEWYTMPVDVVFARPAVAVGDTITVGKNSLSVTSIDKTSEGEIVYNSQKGITKCSSCPTFGDITDVSSLGLTPKLYAVNELLTIINNSSKHPFNAGDKVRVMHIDIAQDMPRFIVKKGNKFGAIYGVDLDTEKAKRALTARQVAAAKVAEIKAKMPTFEELNF